MGIEKELIEKLRGELPTQPLDYGVAGNKRIFVKIDKEAIKKAVQVLIESFGARFVTAVGMDVQENLEVNYIFSIDSSGTILSFRVALPKTKPEIDSIAGVSPGANWIEREIKDLLGVEFKGHPDPRKLILPDDWPEGSHPLRKAFQPT